jgi:hypothetical protein
MRLGTAMKIGLQLLREKTDKTKLNRRRAIQSALYFDAFLKQLQERQPAFCTFFTNHVAAAMHRFWAATFRDDYGAFTLPEQWVSAYSDEIRWGNEPGGCLCSAPHAVLPPSSGVSPCRVQQHGPGGNHGERS